MQILLLHCCVLGMDTTCFCFRMTDQSLKKSTRPNELLNSFQFSYSRYNIVCTLRDNTDYFKFEQQGKEPA
jgi:hypothetical protein